MNTKGKIIDLTEELPRDGWTELSAEEKQKELDDRKKWQVMRELVNELAGKFAQRCPGAGKGAYKYYLFNTIS
jgi:hypothetical protein